MNRLVGTFLVACLAAGFLDRTGHTETITLRNHSYITGGSFNAVTGYDPPAGAPRLFEEFETIATRLVAGPADYPFKIKKLRVLAAGSGTVAWAVDLWQDTNDTTAAPDVHFYLGSAYTFTGTIWNEIDLSADNIMVASGGVRVGLTYISGGAPPGIGADSNGFTARRNFVRGSTSTWSFAENVAINGDFIIEMDIDTPGLSGDYNDDGTVDAADYVVWRKFNNTMTALPNDPNGTPIDGDQYNTWRANFGDMAGSGSGASANTTVPEPTTLVTLMFAAAGWYCRRGRAA